MRMKTCVMAGLAMGALVLGGPALAQQVDNEAENLDLGGQVGDPAQQQQVTPGNVQADPDTVRQVQEALNNAGYNAGNVDGTYDDDVHNALAQFQRAQGLEVNGLINEETLSTLGVQPRDDNRAGAGLQGAGSGAGARGQADEAEAAQPGQPGADGSGY